MLWQLEDMNKSPITNKILFFLVGFALVAGSFLFISFVLPKPANAIPIVGECDPAGSCCGCHSRCNASEACVQTSGCTAQCPPAPTSPPQPSAGVSNAPPPPGPGPCTNPGNCGNGGECCYGFDCCVDASLGCTVGKCVPSSNCIPNKYDCRQSSCVPVCGRNCNDCTGCDPTQGTGDCCPGGGTSCCCRDGCDPNDANACQGGGGGPTQPPQPTPVCDPRTTDQGSCTGSGGQWRSKTADTCYSTNSTSCYAGGCWDQRANQAACQATGGCAWGGTRPTCFYCQCPPAPTRTPTPTTAPPPRGWIRNYVFYDKNSNARPNNVPNTDKYLAGLTLTLRRTNRAAFSDTCTTNSTAQAGTSNCSFGHNLYQNDYYVTLNINGFPGYKLTSCANIDRNQSTLPSYNYIYCLNASGSLVLRRYGVGNCGGPFCSVQNIDLNTSEVNVMYPFVPLASPTPTNTPTPTPTNTPTPTPTLANLPWFKLKNTSFSRVGNLINKIPAVPQSFDSDDPAPVERVLELNQLPLPPGQATAGIVSAGSITLSDNTPYPKTSTNDWKITSYNPSAGFSVANFVSYVKSRKEYTKINNLSEITASKTLYLLETTPPPITSGAVANDQYVLIVNGNLTIDTNQYNPLAKKIAFVVTGTLTITGATSDIRGLFIANKIVLGTGGKLKVTGNLISETPIDISPRTNNTGGVNFAPVLFVKFDSTYYTSLLPYLSTATYEWRQLQ